MGRTLTPTFRMELTLDRGACTPMGWDHAHLGRPSDTTLAAKVHAFERSTQPGGVNAHLGATKVLAARVVRQSTGVVVATYTV